MADTMFSTREVPWMRLGKLETNPLNAEDAAREAGLDFTVSLRDIQFNTNPGADVAQWERMGSRKMVVRDDTNLPFDVVSDDYSILQYSEAFDFLSQIDPKFVAAGSIKDGKQAFMVIQMPEFKIENAADGNDPHDLYAIIRSSHDRSRAVEVMCMPLRGRCMNQMGLRLYGTDINRWAVKHVGDLSKKLHQAHTMVERVADYGRGYEKLTQRLVVQDVTVTNGEEILKRVIRSSPRQEDAISRILTMWQTRETVGYAGTGWGLVNAVSEYFDWERSGGSAQSRLLGAMEGQTFNAINRTTGLLLSRA